MNEVNGRIRKLILFYIICVGGSDLDWRKFCGNISFCTCSKGCGNLAASNIDRKKTISDYKK
jgi:hypothetical protein